MKFETVTSDDLGLFIYIYDHICQTSKGFVRLMATSEKSNGTLNAANIGFFNPLTMDSICDVTWVNNLQWQSELLILEG